MNNDILLELVKEEGLVKKILEFKKEFEYAELKERYAKKLAEIKKITSMIKEGTHNECFQDEHKDEQLGVDYFDDENSYRFPTSYCNIFIEKTNKILIKLRGELLDIKIEEYLKFR